MLDGTDVLQKAPSEIGRDEGQGTGHTGEKRGEKQTQWTRLEEMFVSKSSPLPRPFILLLFSRSVASDSLTPLPLEFSRQEHWSGVSFPTPGDLPDPVMEPVSLVSPTLVGRFFTTSATWEALYKPIITLLKLLDLLKIIQLELNYSFYWAERTTPWHDGDLGSESSLRDWDGRDFWRLIFKKRSESPLYCLSWMRRSFLLLLWKFWSVVRAGELYHVGSSSFLPEGPRYFYWGVMLERGK